MRQKNNSLWGPAIIILFAIIVATGVYISKSSSPSIKADTTEQPSIQINPISKTDHILGNPTAPIMLVEFSDLECPYCQVFEGTMNTLMGTYGKDGNLAWTFRHFPLDSIHPKSRKEAEASECANELGGNSLFWKYTENVFATTTSNNTLDPAKLPIIAGNLGLDVTKFNDCLASGKYAPFIEAQFQDGLTVGAQGTPYNVIVLKTPLSDDKVTEINNYLISTGLGVYVTISPDKKYITMNGALPLKDVQKIIDIILK